MTQFELPLAELTMPQKLELFEALWNDLTRDPTTLASPPWHEEILQEREKALATGEAKVSDWQEAKERIKRRVSCG
jgi:hypothetical protein